MKEKLQKKIQELKKAKEEYIGQINAINGAMQFAEGLLKDLEKESKKEGEKDVLCKTANT